MLAGRESAFLIISRLTAMVCLSLPLVAMAQSSDREPAFRDNFYDVVAFGQEAWIAGYYGTLLHSSDGAATWMRQNSQTAEALFRIVFPEKNMGWASGSYGTLLYTPDRGRSWHKQTTHTEEHLLGLHFLDNRLGWAVGSRGVVLRTEDGGATWLSASVGEDVILNDVRFIGPKRGWAVGEFGRIYHSRDGGRRWTKQKSPIEVSLISGESRNLFRLLFGAANDAWAFGLDGAIVKTRDGERWELAKATAPATKRHHLFSAASFIGKKYAVGERGTILISPADKDQWKPAGFKIPPISLNGITFGTDGLGLIVGNRGLILRSQNGGIDWEQIEIVDAGRGKGEGRSR